MNDLNLKTKESALFALNSLPDSRTNLQTNCIKEYFKQFEFFNDKNDEFVYKYAATAVLAVTEITGCDILRDNEEYDSWCILLHGFCENVFNGMVEHYQPGKVFGIISEDTNRCKYHKGNLRTLEKLCIFACIPAYNVDIIYSIQLKNSREILEENKIVAVTIEDNCGKDDLNKSGITLANATEEFLIKSLFDEKDTYNMESFYYHFLLTYKIFLPNIVNLCKFIENSLELNKSVEKIFQFVYHWVDFHFEDFETNLNLINFLNKFIDLFKKISSPVCHYDEMLLELCSVKASIIDFKLVFDSQNCKKDYKFLVDTNGNYKKLFILSSNTNLVDLKGFEIISINSINVMNMDFKSLLSIQYLNSSEMNLQIRYNFLDINKMQDEYWLIHSNEVPCQYDDKCCHSFVILYIML
ncbi:hypothetical protein A3Q56_07754 [Intoshia linei]|uniref:N-terminal Ras-GEF domain-containing protein n=1 Tax=Intoshia linei TaxID=1819745 RepID=A0A177AR94_9BILA|nr:hypothetical protein A3Q56_07754 [Intoshia linei]